jgi:hypothetical protein
MADRMDGRRRVLVGQALAQPAALVEQPRGDRVVAQALGGAPAFQGGDLGVHGRRLADDAEDGHRAPMAVQPERDEQAEDAPRVALPLGELAHERRHGLLADLWHVWDTLGLMRQLGLAAPDVSVGAGAAP